MDESSTDTGRVQPGGNGDYDGPITLTTAFELLARPPRRQLLYWLYRYDEGPVSVDDLAEKIDACDAGVPGWRPESVREMQIALHHTHLPKLDDAGVIDYDAATGTIRYVGGPRLNDLIEWSHHEEVLE